MRDRENEAKERKAGGREKRKPEGSQTGNLDSDRQGAWAIEEDQRQIKINRGTPWTKAIVLIARKRTLDTSIDFFKDT